MNIKKRFYLTFPKKLVDQPVLFQLGHKFKVITNIKGASVSKGTGLVALELSAEKEELDRAIEWLVSLGISAEEMKEKKQKN